MTIAPEAPTALRHGKDLVDPELFDKLCGFLVEEYNVDAATAPAVMDQGLAFLYTMGVTGKGDIMAPSTHVDPAWHTFMLHSGPYTDWCNKHFGRYLHHAPNSKTRTVGLMYNVTDWIREQEFEVIPALWGQAAECNESACCGDGGCC
ncbi:hypothetical protein [Streptomyces hydrogenans]|uniref:hypothetical protein n=1 Tax=Streptomyces hydrogenans TaxID=1873719 RepID=UPI0035DC611B